MDDKEFEYAEEQYYEQHAAEQLVVAGKSAASFASGLTDSLHNSAREADKESINNRGKNENDHSKHYGNNNDDDDDDDDKDDKKDKKDKDKDSEGKDKDKDKDKKSSDLGEKDGLDSKEGDSLDSKSKDKDSKLLPEKEKGDTEIGAGILMNLWNKLPPKTKIMLIGIGLFIIAFIIVFLVTFFVYMFDVITGSISSFFGISEVDTKEDMSVDDADGLLTSEEYLINPETNEIYSVEELVDYLKNDGACQTTTLSKIIDFFDAAFDGEYRDYCGYYRYMSKRIERIEETYDAKLDRGLVVSTLFYGFANQQSYVDYTDNVDMEKLDDITNAYDRYNALQSVIDQKGVLTVDNLGAIIDSSILIESGKKYESILIKPDGYDVYYTWVIKSSSSGGDDDDDSDTVYTGSCEAATFPTNAHYSSKKWAIMLRFGENAANAYEEGLRYTNQYEATDSECRDGKSDDELLALIKSQHPDGTARLSGNVRKTNNYFQSKGAPKDLTPFEQKANIETSNPDVFTPYGDMELSYTNGFAYKQFPAFEKSFNSQYIELEYDPIITPKQIEETIKEILAKKPDVNEYLGFEDLDNGEYQMFGDSVIGANCEPYLTAALDTINVKLTDCEGNNLGTTNFKDYIMGVAYGEVGSGGENYVLSQMLAAISYTLHRRNNYLKGENITMKSGECDQVYCSMTKGCTKKTSSISCGSRNCENVYIGGGSWKGVASQSLQDKFSGYYETAKDYLIISNGKVHASPYFAETQDRWNKKAKKGLPFTQIIQEEYQNKGAQVVKCTGEDEMQVDPSIGSEYPTSKSGNVATSSYPLVSPSYGKFYGFAYNDDPPGRNITINPDWVRANIISINTNCPAAGWNKSITINRYAQSNFRAAFSKICNMMTTGITLSDGSFCKLSAGDMENGGAYVPRKTSSGHYSLHAYGIAEDWNYSKKITVNGVTYKPYEGQGAKYKNTYDRFVAALGKEEDCRNINYIIWKYAYKPSGFTWGGDWGASIWDGMHFQVKY